MHDVAHRSGPALLHNISEQYDEEKEKDQPMLQENVPISESVEVNEEGDNSITEPDEEKHEYDNNSSPIPEPTEVNEDENISAPVPEPTEVNEDEDNSIPEPAPIPEHKQIKDQKKKYKSEDAEMR